MFKLTFITFHLFFLPLLTYMDYRLMNFIASFILNKILIHSTSFIDDDHYCDCYSHYFTSVNVLLMIQLVLIS